MRDAFGGAFSIKLMLIFLIIYVSFICIAMNYARAFRVKNRIINIIEQNEGYPAERKAEIETYLNGTGYFISYEDTIKADDRKSVSSCDSSEFQQPGYCIKAVTETNPEYYIVQTYMVFKLPIINANFPIRIQGETRRIETLEE